MDVLYVMWVIGFFFKIVFKIVLLIWLVILFGCFFEMDFDVNKCFFVIMLFFLNSFGYKVFLVSNDNYLLNFFGNL